jgi:hypothetical protein
MKRPSQQLGTQEVVALRVISARTCGLYLDQYMGTDLIVHDPMVSLCNVSEKCRRSTALTLSISQQHSVLLSFVLDKGTNGANAVTILGHIRLTSGCLVMRLTQYTHFVAVRVLQNRSRPGFVRDSDQVSIKYISDRRTSCPVGLSLRILTLLFPRKPLAKRLVAYRTKK